MRLLLYYSLKTNDPGFQRMGELGRFGNGGPKSYLGDHARFKILQRAISMARPATSHGELKLENKIGHR